MKKEFIPKTTQGPAMQIASKFRNFINSYTANVRLVVTDHRYHTAQKEFMAFLREIETRVLALPVDHPHRMKFETMQYSMKRQLQLAATDWERFCTDYHCRISYNSDLKNSKCFYIYIKEKAWPMAPADWEARFNNLPKI